jgi:gallate dioxygenase
MAKIVAGMACSHAPSIAHAYDHGMTNDVGWKPLFTAFEKSQQWLESQKPDVLVVI